MMRIKECQASFTVEAAFVLPICIYVIITMIYVAFYFHDTCYLKAYSDVCLDQVSNRLHEEEFLGTLANSEPGIVDQLTMHTLIITSKEESKITEQIRFNALGKLYISEVDNVNFNIIFEHITVTTTAKVSLRIPLVKYFFSRDFITVSASGRVYHPVDSLRLDYVTFHEIKKTKVYNQVLSLLEKIRGYLP